jgi:hypothetical protein
MKISDALLGVLVGAIPWQCPPLRALRGGIYTRRNRAARNESSPAYNAANVREIKEWPRVGARGQ